MKCHETTFVLNYCSINEIDCHLAAIVKVSVFAFWTSDRPHEARCFCLAYCKTPNIYLKHCLTPTKIKPCNVKWLKRKQNLHLSKEQNVEHLQWLNISLVSATASTNNLHAVFWEHFMSWTCVTIHPSTVDMNLVALWCQSGVWKSLSLQTILPFMYLMMD